MSIREQAKEGKARQHRAPSTHETIAVAALLLAMSMACDHGAEPVGSNSAELYGGVVANEPVYDAVVALCSGRRTDDPAAYTFGPCSSGTLISPKLVVTTEHQGFPVAPLGRSRNVVFGVEARTAPVEDSVQAVRCWELRESGAAQCCRHRVLAGLDVGLSEGEYDALVAADGCAEVSCARGERCAAGGTCEPDPCFDVDCPMGAVCDPTDGSCVARACAPSDCRAGQVCHPASGCGPPTPAEYREYLRRCPEPLGEDDYLLGDIAVWQLERRVTTIGDRTITPLGVWLENPPTSADPHDPSFWSGRSGTAVGYGSFTEEDLIVCRTIANPVSPSGTRRRGTVELDTTFQCAHSPIATDPTWHCHLQHRSGAIVLPGDSGGPTLFAFDIGDGRPPERVVAVNGVSACGVANAWLGATRVSTHMTRLLDPDGDGLYVGELDGDVPGNVDADGDGLAENTGNDNCAPSDDVGLRSQPVLCTDGTDCPSGRCDGGVCRCNHDGDCDTGTRCRDAAPGIPQPWTSRVCMQRAGTANTDQQDSDGDGLGDACDVCPTRYDPEQETVCLAIRGDNAGVLLGAACAGNDRDGDGVPNACDNCPSDPNTGQEDCDGDGRGDACTADGDGDGVPNTCDNCPGVENDQANCNADMETVLGMLDLTPGPGFSPGVGDACDPNPCPSTRPTSQTEVDPATGTRVVVANQQIAGHGVATPAAGTLRTGFRHCRCDVRDDDVPDDSIEQRRQCARRAVCTLSASQYTAPITRWLPMTLEFEEPIAGVVPEVVLDYTPPGRMPGERDDDLFATWNILADGATPDGLGGGRLSAVVWSHAPGFSPPRPGAELDRDLTSHFWSGITEDLRDARAPFPDIDVLAPVLLPAEPCLLCGDAFPLPYFTQPICAVPGCTDPSIFARIPGADTSAVELTAPARIALGGSGLTWIAPEEPPSLLRPEALRLVGLAPNATRPSALLFVQGGVLSLAGEQPGQQPPPIIEPPRDPLLSSMTALTPAAGEEGASILLRGNTGMLFTLGGVRTDGSVVDTVTITDATFGDRVSLQLSGDRPGIVVAAALSARHDAALVIDRDAGRRGERYRLLWIDFGTLSGSVLATFPAVGAFDRFDLSGAPDGSFAMVASRAGTARHAVLWLEVDPQAELGDVGTTMGRRPRTHAVRPLGFAIERGEVVGPARASDLGISVPVRLSSAGPWEPTGHRYSELHPARERDVRACF